MLLQPSAINIRPESRTVLITGASTGIGQCCAITLAGQGFTVFAGVRNPEDADRLALFNPAILPIRLDVTEPDSILEAQRQIQAMLPEGKGLNGLVNNAGIAVCGPLECVPIEDLRKQLEVNVLGPVAVTQAFLPLLRHERGRVVNMGSIAGLNALPFAGPYSASKFALESLTDALRVELQPWGIEVAIIEPGTIATPIWEKSLKATTEMYAQPESGATSSSLALYEPALDMIRKAALRSAQRGIPPEHVAQAVLHALCAPKPKTRYLVGKDAQFRRILRWVPDRLKDALITRKIGLPGKHSQSHST